MEIIILISAAILLLLLNIIWVKIRKRKKKYGLFPGIISLVILSVFGGYSFYLMISHSHNSFAPKITIEKNKSKNDISASNDYTTKYRAERAKYDQQKEHREFHMGKLDILKDICAIQSTYAFFFCLWGLFNVGGREKFYTTLGVIHFSLACFFSLTDINSILSLSLA